MRTATTMAICAALALAAAGCGKGDPNVIAPGDLDGISKETQAQEYVDGTGRALVQLQDATGPALAKAIDTGNKRLLQMQALAWEQGAATLRQQNPPKDAIGAHKRLVAATQGMRTWNDRLVAAAPNKQRVGKLALQASASPEWKSYEAAKCELVDLGYEVVDPSSCGAFEGAGGAGGDPSAVG